jgi:ligand-binding sensor domain-containing protein
MNIKLPQLNVMVICYSLTAFISCQGQDKHTANTGTTTRAIGRVVSEIDKSIWVIFQDRHNYYWFGSNGQGVYRYNGKDITQFTIKDGLSSNRIRGIQEDRLGNLYFDTVDGVTKFNGSNFTSLVPVKSAFRKWELQPDDLWFKRNGDLTGAYRYDGDTLHQLDFSTITTRNVNSKFAVYSIYKDKRGYIWFGTLTAGVARFDGVILKWIFENELETLEDGRAPAIRSILEDQDGYFWFSNLLYQYDIKTGDQKEIQYDRIKRIEMSKQQEKMVLPYYTSAVLDNENIWMTNYNEGVWTYDGKKLTRYPINDNGTNVLTMFVYRDHAGSIWVGTDNSGVYKFTGNTFKKFNP